MIAATPTTPTAIPIMASVCNSLFVFYASGSRSFGHEFRVQSVLWLSMTIDVESYSTWKLVNVVFSRVSDIVFASYSLIADIEPLTTVEPYITLRIFI